MPYFYTQFEPWKTSAGMEISGTLGGVYDGNGHRIDGAITFKRQKINPDTGLYEKGRGVIAMQYARPTNPQTASQQYQRHKLVMAIESWQSLSASEKEAWRQKALSDPYRTGHNIFVSRYLNEFLQYSDVWNVDFNDWGMNWISSTPIWNVDFNDW